jgi:hypothetical protein
MMLIVNRRHRLRGAIPSGAPKPAPLTVAEAASTGDRRELLIALQSRVDAAVADPWTHPRHRAVLLRLQLGLISGELEDLDGPGAADR